MKSVGHMGKNFAPPATGYATGYPMKFFYHSDALPLSFGVSKSAEWLADSEIAQCDNYREAVRMCWIHRRSKGMTQATLADLAGLYPQHVSDYLKEFGDRDLPAKHVAAFEEVCGNRAITQWEMKQRGLTIMEEVIARKAA